MTRLLGETVEIDRAEEPMPVFTLGQSANFHTDRKLDPEILKAELNTYLPEDIGVVRVEKCRRRFHSRLERAGKNLPLPGGPPAREKKMFLSGSRSIRSSAFGCGGHAGSGPSGGEKKIFAAFSSMKKTKKSTVRRLESVKIRELPGKWSLEFTGNGFLYNMVRILTGTLLEIGMGKREPESIGKVFQKNDRNLAGFTAPARGLTLVEVFYPKNS